MQIAGRILSSAGCAIPAVAACARRALSLSVLAAFSLGAHGQNQVLSAGYGDPWVDVAPGQVLTLTTPALNVPDAVATQTPLPTSLSGVSVLVRVAGAQDVRGFPTSLPIFRVYTVHLLQVWNGAPCPADPNSVVCSYTQITVEIPTEGVCAPNPIEPKEDCTAPPFHDLPPMLVLNVRANGVTGPDLPVYVASAGATHLLNSCDSIFGPQNISTCHPAITHADGTLVSGTGASPVRVGETIVVYLVGLGTCGFGLTGYPTGSATTVPVQYPPSCGTVLFTYHVSAGTPSLAGAATNLRSIVAQPDWVGLIPGYVGLYQINVTVPPMPDQANPCSTQLSVPPSGYLSICVQP